MTNKNLQEKSQDKNDKALVPEDTQPKELSEKTTRSFETSTIEAKNNIIKYHFTQAIPIMLTGLGAGDKTTPEGKEFYKLTLTVRQALMDGNSQAYTVDKILAEIIYGAYQDRLKLYCMSSSDTYENLERNQRIRQSADNHLLRVIQAFKNFKRPPVNVIVKQTDQVNIADKQVNVSQPKGSPSDLDKKNEKSN